MDLPWNPAVLEQRIGRAHRLGQTRPIQVVNFIARGTIEDGMRGTLAFKRSVAMGILDGTEGDVRLGETKLARLRKEVQRDTAVNEAGAGGDEATPEPERGDAGGRIDERIDEETPQRTAGRAPSGGGSGVASEAESKAESKAAGSDADAGATAGVDTESDVRGNTQADARADGGIDADGMAALEGLSRVAVDLLSALRSAAAGTGAGGSNGHPWIERDREGGTCLKLPISQRAASRWATGLAAGLEAMAQAMRSDDRDSSS